MQTVLDGLGTLDVAAGSVGLCRDDAALTVFADGFPRRTVDRYATLPLDAPLPGPAVVCDGRPRYFASRADTVAAFPDALTILAGTSFGRLPAAGGGGRCIGFLAAHFAGPRAFSEPDR